jgi:hypothetical protein
MSSPFVCARSGASTFSADDSALIDQALSNASVRAACVKVINACVALGQVGCRILGAHAAPRRPTVIVAPPPDTAGLRGVLRGRRGRQEILVSLLPSGVLVQWCVQRQAVRAGGRT